MWWSSQPRQCLKIGPDELIWAQAGRAWIGARQDRCVTRRLEPGLLTLSPLEPNLTNPTAVQDQLRTLVGPARRLRIMGVRSRWRMPMPIVLLLPDVCVRTAVFSLEKLPRRAEERDALVRWRFSQEHLFPLAGARVVYHTMPSLQREHEPKRTTVVAAAIQESVVAQYEALCEACHLVPVEITTAGLRLCNLWLESRRPPTTGATEPDTLWVSLLDHSFSTLAFQQGHLTFTRTKPLNAAEAEYGSASDRAAAILKEVRLSVQVWQERRQAVVQPRIVLVAPQAEPTIVQAIQEGAQLPVESLDWTLFHRLGWAKRMQQAPLSGMAAVAGLC